MKKKSQILVEQPPPLDILHYIAILVKGSKYRCIYNVHVISKN